MVASVITWASNPTCHLTIHRGLILNTDVMVVNLAVVPHC